MNERFTKFCNEIGDSIVVRHGAIRYVVKGRMPNQSVLILDNETRITVCYDVDTVYEKLYKDS